MAVPIYQVNAFTDQPFGGNPAAVCLLESEADATWMQNVALEMNLSETAFLVPRDDGYQLRWFTPAVEVDLCGHATLASAHVLFHEIDTPAASPIIFHTRSGQLTATLQDDSVVLDFPAQPATPCEPPEGLRTVLNVTPKYVGETQTNYLVVVELADDLRRIAPDFRMLNMLVNRRVIVTTQSDDPRFDFLSRYFAPNAGVDEDPVTGSAHCTLGPYWQEQLGKSQLTARQISQRGGTIRVNVRGDRVDLAGRAVTTMVGTLRV